MFKPNEIERISMAFDKPMRTLEMQIMQDIVRRIKINGEITRSADWQINRLYELGMSKSDIEKALKDNLNISDEDIHNMYSDVIKSGYTRDENLYKSVGKEFVSFQDNFALQQLLFAVSMQTSGELKNISRSLGFAIKQINGQIKFQPIAEYYQNTLDNAIMSISSGVFDYNTVLKRVVNEMTNSGLRTVDYATGWSNRVDVAARRAVMTGMSQLTAKVNEDNAKELDTDMFEVTWHSGARPSHQMWQGKWYTKKQLETVCGLGTVTGLCGANCYHDYYPVIPGISEPTYTKEELAEMNRQENTPIEYNGKQYTKYEALQRQRRLETTMRAERQKIKLLQEGGANEDDIITARARYRGTSHEYSRFSKAMDLPQQRQRVTADGLGNIGVGKYKSIVEIEKSSKKHLPTSVNFNVVNSPKYKEKFRGISDNIETDELICEKARDMLNHRNNTYYEDMYLFDSESKKVVGVQTHSLEPQTVTYNESLISAIKNHEPNTLISMHNHPESKPPSGSDFSSCGKRKYKKGVICCHNGDVYIYQIGKKPFSAFLFDNTVDKYKKLGYTEDVAYTQALIQFERDYGIKWEVR